MYNFPLPQHSSMWFIVTSYWTLYLWFGFFDLKTCTETLSKTLRHLSIKYGAQSFPKNSGPFSFNRFHSIHKFVPSIGSMLPRGISHRFLICSKTTQSLLWKFYFTPHASTLVYCSTSGSLRKSPVWQFIKNCWRHPTISFSSHSVTFSTPSPFQWQMQSAKVNLVYWTAVSLSSLHVCVPRTLFTILASSAPS